MKALRATHSVNLMSVISTKPNGETSSIDHVDITQTRVNTRQIVADRSQFSRPTYLESYRLPRSELFPLDA